MRSVFCFIGQRQKSEEIEDDESGREDSWFLCHRRSGPLKCRRQRLRGIDNDPAA